MKLIYKNRPKNFEDLNYGDLNFIDIGHNLSNTKISTMNLIAFNKIFKILNLMKKFLVFLCFIFMIINSILEIIGIGLIIPLISFFIDTNIMKMMHLQFYLYKTNFEILTK